MVSYKQLTFSDRNTIESGISHNESFKSIAKKLNRGTSTITNEVRKNSTHIDAMHSFSNDCAFSGECHEMNLCGDMNCPFPCKWCRKRDKLGPCSTKCGKYNSIKCNFLLYPPYVCNNCQQKDRCIKEKYFYNARDAEDNFQKRKIQSHCGPRLTDDELKAIDDLLYVLIKKNGQSLEHIYPTHTDILKVSISTLYNYINKGYFKKLRAIDLRNAVSRKPRSRNDDYIYNNKRKDRSYKEGRSFADYLDYVTSNTDRMVTEMDTVIGKQKESKRVLTLEIKRYSILIILLLDNGKSESVVKTFDLLEHKLGLDRFRRLFPIILTDNGPEFQQVERLEQNYNNEIRTNIYYCNPYRSNEKGTIEKAHEFIRYVLPKGTSFMNLEQSDFTLIMNHINSYQRKKLNGRCPYDIINDDDEDMKQLMAALHLYRIPPDQVNLTPSLLKNKK